MNAWVAKKKEKYMKTLKSTISDEKVLALEAIRHAFMDWNALRYEHKKVCFNSHHFTISLSRYSLFINIIIYYLFIFYKGQNNT